ncbi:MAG: 3-hydroxyacyl-CoA dehydrogenase family protein [Gammaproteobacteria bacterium]|nr:MAG: 3-hydroxyacyl-CoA dehydrogenase family protein [Gammaproteobacteria bacterium]
MLINVLGLGVMGTQIAALLATLGFRVVAWDRYLDADKREQCSRAQRMLARKFSPNSDRAVEYVSDLTSLVPALTIEALTEDLTIKHKVLQAVPYQLSLNGLYTNTSSYRPEEVLKIAGALHFFNPVHVFTLVEHVPSSAPTEAQKVVVERLSASGFDVVETHGNRGFVGNYLLFHEIATALKLVDKHGYSPETIDRVMRPLGRPAGVFAIVDLVGVDVTKAILENLHAEDPTVYISPLFDRALARGILGRKNRTKFIEALDE